MRLFLLLGSWSPTLHRTPVCAQVTLLNSPPWVSLSIWGKQTQSKKQPPSGAKTQAQGGLSLWPASPISSVPLAEVGEVTYLPGPPWVRSGFEGSVVSRKEEGRGGPVVQGSR